MDDVLRLLRRTTRRLSRRGEISGFTAETAATSTSDDYLWFVDRKKEAIRKSGEMLSPLEVDRARDPRSTPPSRECAVVGVPSEIGDDDVKAVTRRR